MMQCIVLQSEKCYFTFLEVKKQIHIFNGINDNCKSVAKQRWVVLKILPDYLVQVKNYPLMSVFRVAHSNWVDLSFIGIHWYYSHIMANID